MRKHDLCRNGENMARLDFNAGALLGPLPAVMVTVGDMECSNVLTVAWCGILSTLYPIFLAVSIFPLLFLKKNGENPQMKMATS